MQRIGEKHPVTISCAWLAMLVAAFSGCAVLSGCAMPAVSLRSGDSGSEEGEFEHVITVDESGNVQRGEGDEGPLVAPRAASTFPHQVRREGNTGTSPNDEQSKLTPAPVTPVGPDRSLSEQSNDFHEELARLRDQSRPQLPTLANPVRHAAVAVPESEMPKGVEPTIVHSPRFKLDYDDQLLGPGGIARVELYGTRDHGRTWQKLGEDKDRRSPYDVDVEQDGLYGFRIAVAGRNGLASRPPRDGELPELWVKVDRSTPVFHGNLRAHQSEFHIADDEGENERPTREPTPILNSDPKEYVDQASHTEPTIDSSSELDRAAEDIAWRTHLDLAIKQIESELAGTTSADGSDNEVTDALSPETKAQLAARLRMLYLARGQHERAISNSAHHSTEENEYWSHQMHGLHLLVADDDSPQARRTAAALMELRQANDKLADISQLQIANLTFCTAAHSFGVFETSIDDDRWKNTNYREAKFEAEQPVVLYFEVNNFQSQQHTSREYPDGAWKTSLRGSYTILDRDGRPVQKRELQLRDDICRNRRHDYFVAYKTWMPEINPGHYTLELLIEDAVAGKIGTSTIDFEIVAK